MWGGVGGGEREITKSQREVEHQRLTSRVVIRIIIQVLDLSNADNTHSRGTVFCQPFLVQLPNVSKSFPSTRLGINYSQTTQ